MNLGNFSKGMYKTLGLAKGKARQDAKSLIKQIYDEGIDSVEAGVKRYNELTKTTVATTKNSAEESVERVGKLVEEGVKRNSPDQLGAYAGKLELEAANAEKTRIANQISQQDAQSSKLAEKLSNASESFIPPEEINVQTIGNNQSQGLRTNQKQNILSIDDEGSIDDLADSVRKDHQTQKSIEKFKTDNEKYWKNQPTEEEEMWDLYNSSTKKKDTFKLNNNNTNEQPWASTAKAALGTAVAGGALMAALSSSRGQQNNAQLYGQQPLY